ncbi:MAG: hypothetical protein IKI24_01670 [Clostridia bacterium]|nr:hypothetical protein [Clostridia bacterium]
MFDTAFYLFSCWFLYVAYPSSIEQLSAADITGYTIFGFICIFLPRIIFGIYRKVWRYAGSSDYLTLVIADFLGCVPFVLLRTFAPNRLTFVRAVSIVMADLLGAICMRLAYQFIYANRNSASKLMPYFLKVVSVATGSSIRQDDGLSDARKIKIAIIGAGSVGAMLAEDLLSNPNAIYKPVCFVDSDKEKVGRVISGIPIISGETGGKPLESYGVQEVVIALPGADSEKRKTLYDIYKNLGYKVKSYDYPSLEANSGKRSIRDFAIEDLLYRKEVSVIDAKTASWYIVNQLLRSKFNTQKARTDNKTPRYLLDLAKEMVLLG